MALPSPRRTARSPNGGSTCTFGTVGQTLTPGDFLELQLADSSFSGDSVNVASGGATITFNIPVSASSTLLSSPHFVTGDASATTGGTAVTLTGSSVFTNSSSYNCSANATNSTASIEVTYTSGSVFNLISSTGSPTVNYLCVGN